MRSLSSLLPAWPLLVSMLVGTALATLPHWWTRDAGWVADYDELAFYLPVGAAAYREHPWRLSDPVTGQATYYQSLPTVPGVLLAKALGLGPWHLGLTWRALGGLAVGAGWFLLARIRFRPLPALAVACLLLADPGVLQGQLGYSLTMKALHPPAPADSAALPNPASLPQWRILNPTLCWPWWLAFFTLMARAIAVPSRGRLLSAGIACGLLFHIYFYLWTTAVTGLILAAMIDRKRWRVHLVVLAVGLVVGLPALIESARFRAEHGSDWLLRTDKFLPVSRFAELMIPRMSIIVLLVSWVWVWGRGREWIWLAAIASAASLLLNHTALTGFQLENFHWLFALGPALSFLVMLVVAGLWSRTRPRIARWGPLLAGVLAVLTLGVAGWLYARAATVLPENRRIQEAVSAFHAQMDGVVLPNEGAVAGDPDFQFLVTIGYDLRPLAGYSAVLSPITDVELDTRTALNAYLLGWSRERFETSQQTDFRSGKWGPEARSEQARASKLAARLTAWDAVVLDPLAAMNRFNVRVLARPFEELKPVQAGWVLLQNGPRWTIWVRPR